ncbi:MAG: outer membrane protein assembly factor BamD [Saprospiraceae bacterium]|jgi:outer membrane protein assembly factor BamD
MFKKSVKIVFPVLIMALIFSSCSRDYDKLLKSDDFALKLAKAYEYYEAEDYYKSQMLFEQARPFYRGTKELEKIYFYYTYAQFHQEKYILSAYYFKDFSKNYPNSEYAEESTYMAAYSSYMISPNYKLEQTTTQNAVDGFQLFINTHPNSDRVERCNILIDELRAKKEKKAIATADLYLRLKEYQAATHCYKNVLKDYPDTRSAASVRMKILSASFDLASNSVDSKKAERFENTIQEYKEFMSRHSADDTLMEDAKKIYQSAVSRLAKIREL